MSRRLLPALLIVALVATAWLLWPHRQPREPGFSLQGLLGGEAGGYARATAPRPFAFPADHGPHPDFRSEWWYLTGNLYAADGRRFGFQFTIFRFALAPDPRVGASDWGTRQAYMAHLTVTDLATGRFHAFERFARGGAGLAGARVEPFAVWLEDWRLAGEGEPWPWRLRAAQGDVGVDLRLEPLKPPVLQGERGLSRKGPEPGNASFYYSYSRLSAAGELSVGGERFVVTGSVWLDREWSTSSLGPGLAGWDWFSLQLDDGAELMVYRLRQEDGGSSPSSAGLYIPRDGEPRPLEAGDFSLTVEREWRSPKTGVSYPSRWRLRVPGLNADLTVAAAVPAQELDLAVRYWEGAVDVRGALAGAPVAGTGYMELTGYAPER